MAKKSDKSTLPQEEEEQSVVDEEVESSESDGGSDSLENTEEEASGNEDSSTVEQEPSDSSEEQPAVKSVILVHSAALGNGTRERGTIMGSIGENGDLVPADGITEGEVKTLSLNPHLYEIKEAKQ